jgi:hypothetical protein
VQRTQVSIYGYCCLQRKGRGVSEMGRLRDDDDDDDGDGDEKGGAPYS